MRPLTVKTKDWKAGRRWALRNAIATPGVTYTIVRDGRLFLKLATTATTKNQSFDRSANLAILAMASALLGICSQFIKEQEDD